MDELSKYEEVLYNQLEDTKRNLKLWQDRCVDAETKLASMTTRYNALANEMQALKRSVKKC